ncbi:UBP-type zinc finger domain-containing protein [Leifsonia poae]|uniref:UBP-type zinc finger domain-containing protein n=1 Tax=Leifsonia poae TaxID=110933 RepID=UPI001CBE83C5|nr:UBP-type zinc finger domain-containing protein [Leifsonia poae]
MTEDIDTSVPPSGAGCLDCDNAGGWWVHLRRCAECGNVGCCDDSLSRHARAHATATGHRYIQSFEPGEDWFWDYRTDQYAEGPQLAPPTSHPEEQSVPGPAARLPRDWQAILASR